MTQRVERLRDRRGMVSKIVDDFYTARFATHFLAPRNTGKSFLEHHRSSRLARRKSAPRSLPSPRCAH